MASLASYSPNKKKHNSVAVKHTLSDSTKSDVSIDTYILLK